MSRHATWLWQEITQWRDEGLIDESTAVALRARYPIAGNSRVMFILSSIGALVIGLGVILFFAYNWSAMPKAAKLASILGGLLLSHGLALWLRRRPVEHANLIEGFHLIGTMLFGAGIWLIAQIYHMDEHYPTALLIWGLGALVLAWAMPSVIQGALATMLIAAWGLSETLDFNRVHLSSIGIIALALLPLAWWQRSRTLLGVTLSSLIGLTLLNFSSHWNNSLVLKLLFCSALFLLAAAHWSRRSRFPESRSVFKAIGALFYAGCLFYMSFDSEFSLRQLSLSSTPDDAEHWTILLTWVLLATTTALWLWVLYSLFALTSRAAMDRTQAWQGMLVLASMLILWIYQFESAHAHTYLLILATNVILAAHGVLLIIRGTDRHQWWLITVGFLTLCVLIMARFGDLFDSLLLRSLAFVVMGSLLFHVGHRYSKGKLAETSAEASNA